MRRARARSRALRLWPAGGDAEGWGGRKPGLKKGVGKRQMPRSWPGGVRGGGVWREGPVLWAYALLGCPPVWNDLEIF